MNIKKMNQNLGLGGTYQKKILKQTSWTEDKRKE